MNEIKIQQLKNDDPLLYMQFLNLRNDVLKIPLGLNIFDEDLSKEMDSIPFIAVTSVNPQLHNSSQNQEEKVIGCILLEPQQDSSGSYRIRQVAVSPDYQGGGLGTKLILAAEKFARDQGKRRLYVYVQKTAIIGFYQKLGYQLTSEPEFLEYGIPHVSIEKIL